MNSNINNYNTSKSEPMKLNLEIIAFLHKITQSLANIIESTILEYCHIVIILKNRTFSWLYNRKLDEKKIQRKQMQKCKNAKM